MQVQEPAIMDRAFLIKGKNNAWEPQPEKKGITRKQIRLLVGYLYYREKHRKNVAVKHHGNIYGANHTAYKYQCKRKSLDKTKKKEKKGGRC